MPKYCANLEWLFVEHAFLDRFAAAKEAGFDAVEILSPYESPAQDIVNALGRNDLRMAMMSCPPPNYTGGAPGFAAMAGSEGRFRQDFRRSLRYASLLKTDILRIEAGAANGPEAQALLIDNLRWAAAEAPKQILALEPSSDDGLFLGDIDLACDVIKAADVTNLKLVFDTYHVARTHGDLLPVWSQCRDLVAHVQVAQLPHRTEPTAGKSDVLTFLERVAADGFEGWISAQYGPSTTTRGSLGWMS